MKPDRKETIPQPPLNKRELAEHYKISTRTVDNWIANRQIPFRKIGALVRFDLAKVDEALGGEVPAETSK